MKTILFLLLIPLGLFGAVPAMTDFNANQFVTTGNKITVKSSATVTNLSGSGGTILDSGSTGASPLIVKTNGVETLKVKPNGQLLLTQPNDHPAAENATLQINKEMSDGDVQVAMLIKVNNTSSDPASRFFAANTPQGSAFELGMAEGSIIMNAADYGYIMVVDNLSSGIEPFTIYTNSTEVLSVDEEGILNFEGRTPRNGVQAATILNSPTAGNATFWIPIKIGGTNYAIPAWKL